MPILIEIKDFKTQQYNPGNPLENTLCEMIKNYKGNCAIMSFNPYVLKWFRLHAPDVIRGQLSQFFKEEKLGPIVKFALKRMMLNRTVSKPHFIAYLHSDLPNRFVKKFKKLPLLAWPVPSQQEYMRIAPYCDNIIFENFEPKI